MSEHEDDELMLHMPDRDFLMTRWNSRLYTFAGNLSTRDHVFIITEEVQDDDESVTGTYVFAHSHVFAPLTSFMVHHAFPMNLNANEVQPCDEQAFQLSLDRIEGTLDEDFPPEWL